MQNENIYLHTIKFHSGILYHGDKNPFVNIDIHKKQMIFLFTNPLQAIFVYCNEWTTAKNNLTQWNTINPRIKYNIFASLNTA